MAEPATTKMSSKGQVVIPGEIRKRLGLEAGSRFVVVAEKDTIIMKAISPPSMDQFDTLIGEARKQARIAGMKPSDIKAIIEGTPSGTALPHRQGRSRAKAPLPLDPGRGDG